MESNVADNEEPTLDDLLNEQAHLPSAQEADELVTRLLEDIYDQQESGHHFVDVAFTYRPARGNDYLKIEDRRRAGGLQYGRVKPTIGFQPYWHPVHAPIPVVAFKMVEESGYSEWWTETVHPRLVAGGREEVMKHLAEWLYHEIHEATTQLSKLLQWLSVTREAGTLAQTWPVQMHQTPGDEWDVDPDDRVPRIGMEEGDEPAKDVFSQV
ncbi:hypothetical protein BSZ35_19100 [Salinibacter sp. 10B]|uniref:hypothetical protein n=1 Tax=Salinibacter sp. 10B TaxID=1923971 RepID=UPI000CF43357|nr:hypothetical protein [Salinibacter sp. 10B]PQJ26757.1 hypothetical protein BSZ35_19100 [Salinibacter sp. 10B]